MWSFEESGPGGLFKNDRAPIWVVRRDFEGSGRVVFSGSPAARGAVFLGVSGAMQEGLSAALEATAMGFAEGLEGGGAPHLCYPPPHDVNRSARVPGWRTPGLWRDRPAER